MPRAVKNELGKRYGKLLVVSRAVYQGRRAYWLAQCDCGNTHLVLGDHLRRGATRSCGQCYLERRPRAMRDETGNRYGRLVVIETQRRAPGVKTLWVCKCDCGRETVAAGYDMRKGIVKSCGCVRKPRDPIHYRSSTDQPREKHLTDYQLSRKPGFGIGPGAHRRVA